jgi:lysophospholipase L1-like esterase
VFLPASGDRATVLLHHTTGPYETNLVLDGPIRWTKRGRKICFGSGSQTLACGVTHGEVEVAQQIPFGAGWDSEIVSCSRTIAPEQFVEDEQAAVLLALAGLLFAGLGLLQIRLRTSVRDFFLPAVLLAIAGWGFVARIDPWWTSPLWPLATASVALALSLIGLILSRTGRNVALAALALAVGLWVLLIPHPLVPRDTSRLIDSRSAPPLWVDAAYWSVAAPHQRLGFPRRSFGELLGSDVETWLVLGGSVAAGREAGPNNTFTAVAERRLTVDGFRVRLVNAAVQGWNLGQVDRFLRDFAEALPVRGIVLASVLNNAAFRIVGPPTLPGCSTLACGLAHNIRRNYLLLPTVNFFVPKPANRARFQRLLAELLRREIDRGRAVVLLDESHDAQLRPRWYNVWLSRPHDAYRAAIREVASAHGIELHSVDDVLVELSPDEQFLDGVHLTRAGHAAVGARLAEILKPLLREGDG